MNVLDASELQKSYGPTRLLDGVSFALGEDEKVGIVGRNGSGKSTLLRILAGLEDVDGGRISSRRGLTVSYLPQRPALDPNATVREVLEAHLGQARERLRRHEALSAQLARAKGSELDRLLDEQHALQAWLDLHRAWDLGHRVDEVCSRFAIPDPGARIGTLSGGWNQRVALAGLVLAQPDVLLLDEPTNQLDFETIEWLEGHLASYPGAVLLVTHDRYFLDRVVSRMFELEAGKLTAYAGGYSSYLEQKAERMALAERTQERLLNLLRREEAWLARGAQARSTKQKARIDRAGDLRKRAASAPARELAFRFGAERALGGAILEASKLSLELGGRKLVRDFDFTLRRGERVGILGPNGCGKTTLIRALLGELEPAAGTVALGKHTRIAYLDQARSGLDDGQRLEEALGEGDWVTLRGPGGETKRHKAGYLEEFLFGREDHRKPISTLSGGERARLLLAKLLLEAANVLVLDEPTNDLDIPTLQVLDEALADFPGSVLMVTHDRYFLDRVATGILHFEGDGRVVFYEGNYELFSALRAQSREDARAARAPEPQPVRPERGKTRTPPALTSKEKQELAEVEAEIARLEERKAEVEGLLADPSRAGDTLPALSREFSTLDGRIEELLARWEELEEKRTAPPSR